MNKDTKDRIFGVNFGLDMVCPHCKETTDTVYEVYSHKKRMVVSRYTIAYICPKCKTILSVTKAEA